MSQYDIDEVKARLSELTRRALAGEEVVIGRDNTPLVRLIPVQALKRSRQPCSGKGQLLWMAPDFDQSDEAELGGAEDYSLVIDTQHT